MKKKLLILFTVSVLYVLFYIIFPVLFGVNDDTTMLLISSGNLTGTPDEHLIYQNIIIGYILKYLYLFFPIIEWYTIHLMSAQIISITIITYVLLKEIKDRKNFISILSFIALLFFVCYFIINLQFTTTSFLLAGTSYLLLYSLLKRQSEIKTYQYLFIVFLLLWSFLIRNQVFLVTTFLLSPLFFNHLRNKRFIKYSSFLLLLLGIAFGYNYYKYNSNSGWKYYKELTYLRHKVFKTDNPYLNLLDLKIDNLSNNQINIITNHVFPTDKFNIQNLDILKEKIDTLSDNKVSLYQILLTVRKQIILSVLLIILLLLYRPFDIKLFLVSAIFLISLVYLASFNVIKARVFYGMLFVIFLFITYKILSKNETQSKLNYGLLSFLWVFQILFFSYQFVIYFNINKETKAISKKQLECLNNKDIYVSYSGKFKPQGSDPFKVSYNYRNKNILHTGWLLGSPIYNKQIELFFEDYKDENTKAFIEKIIHLTNNDIHLIGEPPQSLKEYALNYDVEFHRQKSDKCKLYNIKKINKNDNFQ